VSRGSVPNECDTQHGGFPPSECRLSQSVERSAMRAAVGRRPTSHFCGADRTGLPGQGAHGIVVSNSGQCGRIERSSTAPRGAKRAPAQPADTRLTATPTRIATIHLLGISTAVLPLALAPSSSRPRSIKRSRTGVGNTKGCPGQGGELPVRAVGASDRRSNRRPAAGRDSDADRPARGTTEAGTLR
jgi:hypothetical protein